MISSPFALVFLFLVIFLVGALLVLIQNNRKLKKDMEIRARQVREAEQLFLNILHHSRIGIVLYDPHDKKVPARIIDCNEAFCEMNGYNRPELVGKSIFILRGTVLRRQKDIDQAYREIQERVETIRYSGSIHGELYHRRKDGSVFPIEYATFLVKLRGKELQIGMDLDIADKRQLAEEQLNHTRLESLGVLAGGIAHDFNNILSPILGNLSIAQTLDTPSPELAECLNEAEKAALQARRITQQLLTFSKGGAPIRKTANLKEIITGSTQFILHGSNLRADFHIDHSLWPVQVDIGQFSQVLQNLIINAMQASSDGGEINITASNVTDIQHPNLPSAKGKFIKISLQDFGPGIPPDITKKIFDPYFTTKEKGHGLGLTTALSIIRQHDGFIGVESLPNKGTTFSIYLPADLPDNESHPETKPASHLKGLAPKGNGRILIMDDEEIVRNVLKRMLTLLGYELEEATDGDRAIALYKKSLSEDKPFDLILMDLTIPGGMGGKEAISKIKEIDPNVKAIVCSGYSDDPVVANHKKYGFIDSISKPFDVNTLSEILEKALH